MDLETKGRNRFILVDFGSDSLKNPFSLTYERK